MKKYIIIMILILLPINIKAETLLTDYYLKEENAKEYKEETEYLKREKIIKYNNYYYDKKELGYFELTDDITNFDLLDYIEEPKYIINDSNERTTNIIKEYPETRYIRFNNFNENILKSLKIFNNQEEIKYQIVQTNYSLNTKLTNSSKFVIELDKIYPLDSLKIFLNFKDNINSKINFNIGIYNQNNYAWNIEPNNYKIEINYNDNIKIDFLTKEKYQELMNILKEDISSENISYSIIYVKKYKLYQPVKVYLSTYTTKPLDNCIHDLDDYKIRYNYYERYYIEVPDIITNKDNIILDTNIPKEEINIITKEDKIIIKYKHDTFYKKITKKEEKEITTKPKIPIEKIKITNKPTTKEIITTTKINHQENKSTVNPYYLLIIPILIIIYIFIPKKKI